MSAASPDFQIRPYQKADRDAVRSVCYMTGFMGEPADWMWRDQESFSDIFTGYWTDREPEHALVAELDGEVVGYLLGCMDSRRVWNAGKLLARHGFVRGVAFRPGTAGVFWRMITDGIGDSLKHRLPPPTYYDKRWPAHLHIDLLPVCRHHGVGSALVSRWLDTLRQADVSGCHLQTMAENTRAIAFFEKMGFTKLGSPDGAPGFRTREGRRMGVQLMVQPLGDLASGALAVTSPAMNERRRKLAKPAAGALGTLGVVFSIWWFALRPRRKRKRST